MSARHAPPAELLALCARALERARARGAALADACAESRVSFAVRVHEGTVESVKQSGTLGLGVRAIVDGAVGFASGTDLSAEGVDDLAARAVALARFGTPDEANGVPAPEEIGAAAADGLEIFDPAVLALPTERRIERALALERAALGHDPRLRHTDGAGVACAGGAFAIANSLGVERAWEGTSASAWVVALADDDGPAGARQQTGAEQATKRFLADLPEAESLGRAAAARALARVGARPVPSARVPVVMHPDVAAAWLAEMYEAFTGEAVLKQASWLTGRLGERIAAPGVTIVDDGRLRRGIGSSPYDGEGLGTRRNLLVDGGTLAAFAYDRYHARRAGTRSTANGVRGFSTPPGTGFHNLFVAPGAATPQAILAGVERGFYFDDQGSFGFNPVTGDYSFQAQGFWIERGEKAYPVDGVTVAGRSLDMLRDVAAVGSDLEFRDSIASPTLLIGEMTVSGT